jgi:hypothetical protein
MPVPLHEQIKRTVSDFIVSEMYVDPDEAWDKDYDDARFIAGFLISWLSRGEHLRDENEWNAFMMKDAVLNVGFHPPVIEQSLELVRRHLVEHVPA